MPVRIDRVFERLLVQYEGIVLDVLEDTYRCRVEPLIGETRAKVTEIYKTNFQAPLTVGDAFTWEVVESIGGAGFNRFTIKPSEFFIPEDMAAVCGLPAHR
jgi:hypothetical protein